MPHRTRPLWIFIAALALLVRCGAPGCAEGVERWIDEAPEALKEFRTVQAEVLADGVLEKKRDTLGRLFVWPSDTVRPNSAELPALRAWFRAGRGFLTMAGEQSKARFRVCDGWSYWAVGVISQGRPVLSHEMAAQLVDTMDLGDGWFAWVTACEDCWD